MIVYGISTCDTCRKARKALEAAGLSVAFRDIRAEPLTGEEIARFMDIFGDRIVNRTSTTWRSLDEGERAADTPVLLAQHPTLMKRPVIDTGTTLHFGWSTGVQATLLK